jgi:hypothetical protein
LTAETPAEAPALNIIALCREILIHLLDGKTPEAVAEILTERGIAEDDRAQLINITVICAQTASPVVEGTLAVADAVKNLTAQGMEAPLAEAMIKMVTDVTAERAAVETAAPNKTAPPAPAPNASPAPTPPVPAPDGNSGAAENNPVDNHGAETAPALAPETLKILMRLASAIALDLQNGGEPATIAEALRQVKGVTELAEVGGREKNFVAEVQLAAGAAQQAASAPLAQVLAETGIAARPPHVGAQNVIYTHLSETACPVAWSISATAVMT